MRTYVAMGETSDTSSIFFSHIALFRYRHLIIRYPRHRTSHWRNQIQAPPYRFRRTFADQKKTFNMSSSDSEDDIPLGKLKKEQKQKSAAASAVPKKVKKEDPEPAGAAAAASATNGNSNGGRKRPAVKYEESSDVSDDDFEPAPKKKKSKAKATSSSSTSAKTPTPTKKAGKKSSSSGSSSSKKKTAVKKESASSAKKKRELKKLEKADRLQHAMQAFLWWDAPEPPAGCQWNTMEHAGVSFPEPYQPHGIKMKYDGKDVDLNPVEEEM